MKLKTKIIVLGCSLVAAVLVICCHQLASQILRPLRDLGLRPRDLAPLAPLHDVSYKTNGDNSNRSVFVIPRRAYLDDRIVNGKPRNIVVILAEVHDEALFKKSIRACELNGKRSKKVRVIHEESLTRWVRAHHGRMHRLLMVECRGFNLPSITNGSITKLIYLKDGEKHYSRVETGSTCFERQEHFQKQLCVDLCNIVWPSWATS